MTILRRTLVTLFALSALVGCGSRSQLLEGTPMGPPPVDVPTIDGSLDVPDAPSAPDVRIDVRPDTLVPTVTVACPAPIRSTQSLPVPLPAMATSNVGRPLTVQWEVTRAPMDSMARLTNANTTTASINFDVGGEFRFRFTARDDLGNMASCETRADVESAIDLLCPNDQSNFQGATVSLAARARSRLMRAITLQWETVSRPMGSSTMPTPPNSDAATLRLDALGDWRLRLVARDSTGLTASCVTNIHADPDVIVTCPPDTTSRPFATATLAAMAQSRTMRPLTFRWEIVDQPITSTAMLRMPNTLSTPFTFDVAGNWTFRFTATNDRGNSAFCTTRALAASEEAVRVEIVWNTDRANPNCNIATPDSNACGDVDLHLANSDLNMGRWGSNAPANSTCFYANCVCGTPEMICTNPTNIEWTPAGVVNNPQLDIDHTRQLPGPENINIVRAETGGRYDVGVHAFSLNAPTPVVARVYCGGRIVFESEPVRIEARGGGADTNDLWLVGRIETTTGGCRFTRCGSPGNLAACIRPQNAWGR